MIQVGYLHDHDKYVREYMFIYVVIQHLRGLEVSDDDIYVVIQHFRGLEVLNDDTWQCEWKVPFGAT